MKQSHQMILAVLLRGPTYGIQISERLSEITAGRCVLGQGSVYPALRELQAMALIAPTQGPQRPKDRGGVERRYYALTDRGTEAALREKATAGMLWNLVSSDLKLHGRRFLVASEGRIPGLFVVGAPGSLHEKKTPAVLEPIFADESGNLLVPAGLTPLGSLKPGAEFPMLYCGASRDDGALDATFFDPQPAVAGHAVLVLGPRERAVTGELEECAADEALKTLVGALLKDGAPMSGLARHEEFVLWHGPDHLLSDVRELVRTVARKKLVAAIKDGADSELRPLAFWLHRAAESCEEAALSAAVLEKLGVSHWAAILGGSTDLIHAGREELQAIEGAR